MVKQRSTCKDDEEKSLKTGRCVKKCKPRQTRNPETGRCKGSILQPLRDQVQTLRDELKKCLNKRAKAKQKISLLKSQRVREDLIVEDPIVEKLISAIDNLILEKNIDKLMKVIFYKKDITEAKLMSKLILKRFKILVKNPDRREKAFIETLKLQ